MSGSRILLNEHLTMENDPVNTQILHPEKVHAAMQKILKIPHQPLSALPFRRADHPPFIIEPIRNVVDWMDDRSCWPWSRATPVKKGPSFSLDAVEHPGHARLRMYLLQGLDLQFPRRSKNVGTFMGEYSGKVEKSAKVVFAGADKKMTMVAPRPRQVDSAGRDTAVGDYIEFIMQRPQWPGPHSENVQAPHRHFFCVTSSLADLQNTVILMLRYAGQTELGECPRIHPSKITNNNLRRR